MGFVSVRPFFFVLLYVRVRTSVFFCPLVRSCPYVRFIFVLLYVRVRTCTYVSVRPFFFWARVRTYVGSFVRGMDVRNFRTSKKKKTGVENFFTQKKKKKKKKKS